MSLDYEFQPIEAWPGERTKIRQRSRFDSPWGKTLDLLDRELEHLNAKNIVIQADCERSEIRIDGRLRANAKLRSPGVILSFDSKHGPLSYPCDRFTDWQDNIRAIALSLEALRTVDRYGVTRRAEQYKGWERLPPPNQSPVRDAAALLNKFHDVPLKAILEDRDVMMDAYRKAAIATHPDRGGSAMEFKKVLEAKETLVQFFEGKV